MGEWIPQLFFQKCSSIFVFECKTIHSILHLIFMWMGGLFPYQSQAYIFKFNVIPLGVTHFILIVRCETSLAPNLFCGSYFYIYAKADYNFS